MIYLDSSGLFKLVRTEAESPALIDWLQRRAEIPLVTSELGRIEVLQAARRAGEDAVAEATALLTDLDLVPLSRPIQDLACTLGEPGLRAPGALHLASAIMIRSEMTAFVSYDHRIADAARDLRLPVVAPGLSGSDS